MIPNLFSLSILYFTLYLILKSHKITKKDILSLNAVVIYSMVIISYFYLNMPIPSIFISSCIFTLKIISRNPLLIFPSSSIQKFQLFLMTYLLFGMIKSVLISSLGIISMLLEFLKFI